MKNINDVFLIIAKGMPFANDFFSKNIIIGKLEINTMFLFFIGILIALTIIAVILMKKIRARNQEDGDTTTNDDDSNLSTYNKYDVEDSYYDGKRTESDCNKDSQKEALSAIDNEEFISINDDNILKNTPSSYVKEVESAEKESVGAKKPSGKYEIILKADGYKFCLIANNGQLLYESMGYTTPQGAVKGIATFKKAVNDNNFIVDEDKFNRYRFILNKRYVGESYTTKAACESNIDSVKTFYNRAAVAPYDPNAY